MDFQSRQRFNENRKLQFGLANHLNRGNGVHYAALNEFRAGRQLPVSEIRVKTGAAGFGRQSDEASGENEDREDLTEAPGHCIHYFTWIRAASRERGVK